MFKMVALLIAIGSLGVSTVKGVPVFETMSTEERAEAVNMSVEEFELISGVVEAESDRSEVIEGRVYIALTILNRVNDSRFPDTVTGVLTQRGQFSTVRNGRSIISRSDLSDRAVLEAYEWIENGDAPEVLFFNCVGYNYGQAFGYIGGNYFMTLGGIV